MGNKVVRLSPICRELVIPLAFLRAIAKSCSLVSPELSTLNESPSGKN